MQKKSLRVLFHVDASSQAGLGHLRRTLALAHALRRRGHKPAFCLDGADRTLPIAMPFPKARTVAGRPWDIAVVDSYTISAGEYRRITARAQHRVLICDGSDPGFPCDMLINHNLRAGPNAYRKRARQGTKILAGPKYAMISPEIVRARRQGFVLRPAIRNILLTLGGGKYPAHRRKLLDWIATAAGKANIRCVVPQKGRNRDMGRILRDADLAVSAAGITSLELACIGVPAILVVLADNQAPGARAAAALGIARNIGVAERWRPEVFQLAYRSLSNAKTRGAMSRKGRALVDGKGAERICARLERLRYAAGAAGKQK